MSESSKKSDKIAFTGHIAEVLWQEFPGHHGGALSKALVSEENSGSKRIDYRISSYEPMAFVEDHVHQVQEQIYHVLKGEGILTLNDERKLMREHDYVYIPPGVRHSFSNTGLDTLVFLVITTPTHDNETPV
jgi:quercetin dioxygenase-like cupin family protein